MRCVIFPPYNHTLPDYISLLFLFFRSFWKMSYGLEMSTERHIRNNTSHLKENNKQTDNSSPEYFNVKKCSLSLMFELKFMKCLNWIRIDDVEILEMFPFSQKVPGQWLPQRLDSMRWLYSRLEWKEDPRYKTRYNVIFFPVAFIIYQSVLFRNLKSAFVAWN